MARKNDVEEAICYHEWNLARLINERNAALKRREAGEYITDYYLERTEATIKSVEETIHNYRTIGRAYK